jgi:hypothetical protein
MITASWMLVTIAAVAGCLGKNDATVQTEKLQAKQQITPEEARAALLKLKSIRVITGGEDDPIYLDLKTGAIEWTGESTLAIGRFFSCNLKENTWEMTISSPSIHFHATAKGKFERQADGTWSAEQTSGSIT